MDHSSLKRLKEGNLRFAAGKSIHPNLSEEWRHETLHIGQRPFVGMLSCADSRAPIEIIFDQGVGDIFSVRNAGNIFDDIDLGSLEIGVYKFDIPLLVVLGHTDCGAIKLAIQNQPLKGSMQHVINKIIPVVKTVKTKSPELDGIDLENEVTKANTLHTIEELQKYSQILSEKVRSNELELIAGVLNLRSGLVDWL